MTWLTSAPAGRISVCLAIFLLAATGCDRDAPPHQERIVAFGTLVDITLRGVDEATAHQASAALNQEFNTIHRRWHAWEPSEVTRINAHIAAGEAAPVDEEVLALVRHAATLSEASDGLFNPAIGQLVAAWGFHSDDTPGGPPPAEELIHGHLASKAQMAQVKITGEGLKSENPDVQLDFGGFIKGYAVDAAISTLRALGVEHAIVNAGGDLRAIGDRGDRPWRIGIRAPRGSGVIASIEAHDGESVFTSGDYERYFEYEGRRYHHILDPRSGYPASGATSVTVVHDDAATADAAATALFIAGSEDWPRVARAMGVTQVMLIDAEGLVHLSPAMAERVRFEVEPKPGTVIQTP